MKTEVIVALISLGGTLLTVLGTVSAVKLQNNKHYALIDFRLAEIEKKQDKHNGVIERVYELEKKAEVFEERQKVANNRISDLEKGEGR